MDLENEIVDMIGDELPQVAEPAAVEEPVVVEPEAPVVTEGDNTDPVVNILPKDDEPIVPETPAEPPVADPKDTQLAELQATIDALREQITVVAQQAVAPEAPAAPPTPAPMIFIEKEEDLDKALSSVESFNTMMAGIVEKIRSSIVNEVVPAAANSAVGTVNQRMMVNEFYRENKDLAANKAYVGVVANELAAANPEWNMNQVLEKLADEVRGRLRLTGVTLQPPPTSPEAPPAPAFAGGSHSRPSGGNPRVDPVAAEIADLIADM